MKNWSCLVACAGVLIASGAFAQPLNPPAPVSANTAKTNSKKPAVVEPSDKMAVMTIGLDYRAERDQQQSSLPRAWPSFDLGFGVKPWLLSLEYARFTESSGNSTLSIDRKAETLLLWGYWFADENWPLEPYMGIGLGGYRSSADLTLYTEHTSAKGDWIQHAAGAFGLRVMNISPFWIAVEGRVHINRDLDPNPTVSGMLKLGFVLE